MKLEIIDILIYLYENYMVDDGEIDYELPSLTEELQDAGFGQSEIAKAFEWIEDLASLPQRAENRGGNSAMRIYSTREQEKIDSECRGYLLHLEQMGVLDHDTRELVVDRVMALESSEVDLDHLKWVILMVLFNQPGHEAAVAWIEDIVLDEMPALLH